jgi:uncharacterized membrane protein HdeD (DUF308 family)
MYPSFLALMISGILIGFTIILTIVNFKNMDNRTIMLLLILLSIAIAVHGILHFVYEINYKWNPLNKIELPK